MKIGERRHLAGINERRRLAGSFIFFLFITTLPASDWPSFRGPTRNGISTETGLLKSWPPEGPRVVWRTTIGDGYSGVSIAGRRLFTMEAKGNDEFVVAKVAATGSELWRARIDSKLISDQGDGPRSTPAVDGNMVFAISGQGMLVALDISKGAKIWSHDLKKEFGANIPGWGFSSSPLVENDLVIVPVGGGQENAVIAFKKNTGAVAWRSQTDVAGYSSPIAVTMNGLRQIIAFTGSGLFSLKPTDGKLIWKFPWTSTANAAMPVFIPDDKIFISTSYGQGGVLLRIHTEDNAATVKQVWKSQSMSNHFSSSVLINSFLYGFDDAILTCIDANTAEKKWQKSGFGKGSLIWAEGHLVVLGERGQLALVEATPQKYKEKAKSQVMEGKCWTTPTLARGKLYLRNQKEVVCLDIKKI